MLDCLVLDTNAFNDRVLPYFLQAYRGRKVLPAAAAAELHRHYVSQRGWDVGQFRLHLRTMGVRVEPLDLRLATLAAEAAGGEFGRRPMDALIAAHALAPGRILVTNDLDDHPQVPRKVTTAELLAA